MSAAQITLLLFVGLVSIIVGLIAALVVVAGIIIVFVALPFAPDAGGLVILALILGLITWLLTTRWYFRRKYKTYE